MFVAYVAVTLLAVVANGSAAAANFLGSEFAKAQADKLRVPRSWQYLLGSLMAAGALGLLVGFAAPPLGIVAATGLVLYFVGAFVAHVRVRDYQLGPWSAYFLIAVAALVVQLGHLR